MTPWVSLNEVLAETEFYSIRAFAAHIEVNRR